MTTRKSALAAAATRRKMAHGAAMWQQYLDAATNGEVEAKEAEGTSLDRIDPHGHYEPENCRWADRITEARNRRQKKVR